MPVDNNIEMIAWAGFLLIILFLVSRIKT